MSEIDDGTMTGDERIALELHKITVTFVEIFDTFFRVLAVVHGRRLELRLELRDGCRIET